MNEKTKVRINEIIQTKEKGKETIQELLRFFEDYYDIKIIYAVESGSRAYGTHTENSDYDVKFIYMKNVEAYLSLDDILQSISWKSDDKLYDFVGYDLKKALKLCRKSNPTFYEISRVPIMYVYSDFFDKIYFSRTLLYNHYRRFLHSNFKKYYQESMTQTHVKKYQHMLRVYLMINFMLEYNTYPSTDIETLQEYTKNSKLNSIMNKLIRRELLNDEELSVLNDMFFSFLTGPSIELPFVYDDIKSTYKSNVYFNDLFMYFVCEFPDEKIIWR